MVLDTSLLNSQLYMVCIKGNLEKIQGKKVVSSLHTSVVAIEKENLVGNCSQGATRLPPFSIATTPRCRGGGYSFPWIAPLYS